MARVLVLEPVQETRFLIERVVERMGHTLVGEGRFDIDVVIYEPNSRVGMACARSAQWLWPNAKLVACSAAPPRRSITGPQPTAFLLQPFAPSDVRRVLEEVLMEDLAFAA